jgi:hypothetical protein
MIKIKINRGLNSPPVDTTPVEFNTQSKVSGFGLSTPDNSIGPAGDPFRGGSSQPRYAMEEKIEGDNALGYELEENHCGCEECMHDDGDEPIKYFELILEPEEEMGLNESLIYEKKDRCYHLAKQKYDVFPSAYASGFIVRCRKGKVGRKKKRNEQVELDEKWSKKYKRSIDCDNPKGFSQRAHCQGRKKHEEIELGEMESGAEYIEKLEEGTFDKEKSQGLHGWFARKGGKGKSKGWVDCNTCRTNPKTGRKTCKTCGRQSGEERSKYPACRPTPSACTRSGMKRKKSSIKVSWKPKKKKEE